jgi:hypothetical protein
MDKKEQIESVSFLVLLVAYNKKKRIPPEHVLLTYLTIPKPSLLMVSVTASMAASASDPSAVILI